MRTVRPPTSATTEPASGVDNYRRISTSLLLTPFRRDDYECLIDVIGVAQSCVHAQKRHTDELEARGFLLGSLFARRAAMQIHKKTEKRFLEAVALLIAVSAMAMTTGCPNTAHGVKADTKRALDKTGQKLEDTADKIDDKKDEKKKH